MSAVTAWPELYLLPPLPSCMTKWKWCHPETRCTKAGGHLIIHPGCSVGRKSALSSTVVFLSPSPGEGNGPLSLPFSEGKGDLLSIYMANQHRLSGRETGVGCCRGTWIPAQTLMGRWLHLTLCRMFAHAAVRRPDKPELWRYGGD